MNLKKIELKETNYKDYEFFYYFIILRVSKNVQEKGHCLCFLANQVRILRLRSENCCCLDPIATILKGTQSSA